jgi:hypothetical protein
MSAPKHAHYYPIYSIHRYAAARHVAQQRPRYRAKLIVTVQKHLAIRGVHLLHARVVAESNQPLIPFLL